jgi:hypothetical protein
MLVSFIRSHLLDVVEHLGSWDRALSLVWMGPFGLSGSVLNHLVLSLPLSGVQLEGQGEQGGSDLPSPAVGRRLIPTDLPIDWSSCRMLIIASGKNSQVKFKNGF